jgi:chromate transporter
MIYLQLFLSFFKIGLFNFGGGYAMLSLIQKEVVVKHSWITNAEFTDIVAISQITPGPIAINSATYIGYRASGTIFGAFFSTLGVVLPSVIVMLLLILFIKRFKNSKFVERAFQGLRYIVIGLILGAALSLMTVDTFIDYKSYILFVLALVASLFFKIGPIPLTIVAGICGFLFYY